MSCIKKKIPIHLLSATTPEGKMEYSQIVVVHACLLPLSTKQRKLMII